MRPMPRQQLEVLSHRFHYHAWRGANRLGEELVVWDFLPTGEELPGWQPQRLDEVEPPGAPRSVQSVWAPARDTDGGLALLDIFECASRPEAHAFILQLLGLFQSPYIARREGEEVGDVAFGDPHDEVMLFARGNLVVSLRPGEPTPLRVRDVAARLDSQLVSKPGQPGTRASAEAPAMSRLTVPAASMRAGAEVRLSVDAEDPRGRRLWFKAFSPTGTLTVHERQLVYRHEAAAAPDVTVFAMAGPRAAARRSLEVTGL